LTISRTLSPALALTLAAGVVALTLVPASPAVAAEPDLGGLIRDRAPAIVSVKFLMKSEQGEEEQETVGVMIEGDGLILTSNAALGGMMRPAPLTTDMKVMVGDDTQGVDAKVIARDTELGLAWIKVDAAPASPFASVDFASAAQPKVGDEIFTVSLMGKFFDRAPIVARGHIASVTAKPRALLIPSIGLAGGEFGLPVFDDQGRIVGVTTFVLPDREEMEANPSGMRAAMRGIVGSMILPAAEVVAATARAKETAASGGGEAAVEGSEAGAGAPVETPVAPK